MTINKKGNFIIIAFIVEMIIALFNIQQLQSLDEISEIKELLLEDDNIVDVFVDQKKRIIKLKPKDSEYIFLEEPLKNFMYKLVILSSLIYYIYLL